jgi:hypothetical protein
MGRWRRLQLAGNIRSGIERDGEPHLEGRSSALSVSCQKATRLGLKNGNQVDGANESFILLPLFRRELTFVALLSQFGNPSLSFRVRTEIHQVAGGRGSQRQGQRFEKSIEGRRL